MSFISILQKIGLIAGQAVPQIIAIVSPPLGALVGTVLNAILVAEGRVGSGKGDEKKQDVMASVQSAIPLILQVVKNGTGKDLADDKLLSSGIEKLNDGLVDVLNAFKILPKAS